MKKCIVFFTDGTEEIEALTPVDILRRAGADCRLVRVPADNKTGRTAVGSHGITVVCDAEISEIGEETPDMVIIPGGMPGTVNIGADADARRIIVSAFEKGKYVAAICAAPSVLGKLGVLRGKNAVCYPGFEKELTGARISDKKVVADGNVITAAGMGVALDFALECAAALFGADAAKKLSAGAIRG